MRRLIMAVVFLSTIFPACTIHMNAQEERIGRLEASKADAAIVDSVMRQYQQQLGQISERVAGNKGATDNLNERVEKLEGSR